MRQPASDRLQAASAEGIQQMAALNGLVLSPERAAALAPAVAELLAVDEEIARLGIERLPAVGLPWDVSTEP